MRARLCALFVLLLMLAGCSWLPSRPRAAIDWVDFVKVKGVTYTGERGGRALQEADLGPAYDQVRFQVSGNVFDPSYKTRDGDAAFLPAGTKLYQVKGYKPAFRLAARRDGAILLFEVDTNPAAKSGSDLLDVEGKVTSITVGSPVDGHPVGKITDRAAVKELVGAVLAAPVFAEGARGGAATAGEKRYMVTFDLTDGTATTLAFWPDTACLLAGPGLRMPPAFGAAIEAAARAPAPPADGAAAAQHLAAEQVLNRAPFEGGALGRRIFHGGEVLLWQSEPNLYTVRAALDMGAGNWQSTNNTSHVRVDPGTPFTASAWIANDVADDERLVPLYVFFGTMTDARIATVEVNAPGIWVRPVPVQNGTWLAIYQGVMRDGPNYEATVTARDSNHAEVRQEKVRLP